MKRTRLQSLRRSARSLYYRAVGMLPVIEMSLYLVLGVLLGGSALLAVIALGMAIQPVVMPGVRQIAQLYLNEFSALIDGAVAIINSLPVIEIPTSSEWSSTESPEIDDPRQWDEPKSMWEPVWEKFKILAMWVLILTAWVIVIHNETADNSTETEDKE